MPTVGSSPPETTSKKGRSQNAKGKSEDVGMTRHLRRSAFCLPTYDFNRRLGRQPADHSRLEREMLWVRIPPEPSFVVTQTLSPRGAAWSARLLVTQEIVGSSPIEDACRKVRNQKLETRKDHGALSASDSFIVSGFMFLVFSAGAVRKLEKRSSSNLDDVVCRFDSDSRHCDSFVVRG